MRGGESKKMAVKKLAAPLCTRIFPYPFFEVTHPPGRRPRTPG